MIDARLFEISDRLCEAWRVAGKEVLRDVDLAGPQGLIVILDALAIMAANAAVAAGITDRKGLRKLANIVRDCIVLEAQLGEPLNDHHTARPDKSTE